MTEAMIRQRIEDLASALRAKDIERVMTLYAPDIVSFDVGPPLRYGGADSKRRAWREALGAFAGPIGYDVRDLRIATQADLAFVHSLNHVRGAAWGCGCAGPPACGASMASGWSCTITCQSRQSSSAATLSLTSRRALEKCAPHES